MCIYVYTYVYIYIYIHTYTRIHTSYIHVYIYPLLCSRTPASSKATRRSSRIGAKDCTPEITKVKFQWKVPVNVHWNFLVKIHWKSVNTLKNTTDK